MVELSFYICPASLYHMLKAEDDKALSIQKSAWRQRWSSQQVSQVNQMLLKVNSFPCCSGSYMTKSCQSQPQGLCCFVKGRTKTSESSTLLNLQDFTLERLLPGHIARA